MYCAKCGKEIPDGEKKVCDECEKSVQTSVATDEKAEVKENKAEAKETKKAEKAEKNAEKKEDKEDKKKEKNH